MFDVDMQILVIYLTLSLIFSQQNSIHQEKKNWGGKFGEKYQQSLLANQPIATPIRHTFVKVSLHITVTNEKVKVE